MANRRKKSCFVLMPFKDSLNDVYSKAIRPACEQAGYKALRTDELLGPFNIHRTIIEHIFQSDAIVADLTDWNPNVFYELGVAHAVSNKVIMIIHKKERVPFDIGNYGCLQYEQTPSGLKKLQEEISKKLQYLADWRSHPSNPVQDFKPRDLLISESTPVEFYSCFLSYSYKDRELAERLHADLQEIGVRCWFAPENLKIGDKIQLQIEDSIRLYDKMLLVLSENSISSNWVEQEIEVALNKEREYKQTVLFPIRVDDAVMKSTTPWAVDLVNKRNIGDFTVWHDPDKYNKAFSRLVRDLTVYTAKESGEQK